MKINFTMNTDVNMWRPLRINHNYVNVCEAEEERESVFVICTNFVVVSKEWIFCSTNNNIMYPTDTWKWHWRSCLNVRSDDDEWHSANSTLSLIHEHQKLVVIKLCGFHVQTIKYVLMVEASWILLPMLHLMLSIYSIAEASATLCCARVNSPPC